MYFGLALAPALILILVVAFLIPVLSRLFRSSSPGELTTEWFENFQVSAYLPMQGLLAQDDFQFLSRQPGFDYSLYRKLRRDRLRIFRQYLNRLIADYNRLHALAYFVISQGAEDQSELFAHLLGLRFQFWMATVRVEFSYFLCLLGSNSLSVTELLKPVEGVSKIALLPPAKAMLVN